jgi:hypothetical protein
MWHDAQLLMAKDSIVNLGKPNAANVGGRGNADLWKYFWFASKVLMEQNTVQK